MSKKSSTKTAASGKAAPAKKATKPASKKATKVEAPAPTEPLTAATQGPTGDAPAQEPPAAPSAPKPASKPRQPLSCLDAAAQVLKDKGQPMRAKDLIQAMAEGGLWSSNAPTPAATLSSALLREITVKGANARFEKTGRGLFGLKAH